MWGGFCWRLVQISYSKLTKLRKYDTIKQTLSSSVASLLQNFDGYKIEYTNKIN
jgi:hypothetical protein